MALLANAKPECYDRLWLRYVHGESIEEIARAEGIEADAARMRINRCLKLLRTLMAIGD